jgi:hypothetical protein
VVSWQLHDVACSWLVLQQLQIKFSRETFKAVAFPLVLHILHKEQKRLLALCLTDFVD